MAVAFENSSNMMGTEARDARLAGLNPALIGF